MVSLLLLRFTVCHILECSTIHHHFGTRSRRLTRTSDLQTRLQDSFRSIPLDDPILFDPKPDGKTNKKNRIYGAEGLGNVNMYSLCEVRMAVEAPFAAT